VSCSGRALTSRYQLPTKTHYLRTDMSTCNNSVISGVLPARFYSDVMLSIRVATRTQLPVEESVRMTEDMGKWRKYVHGVANPGIEDS